MTDNLPAVRPGTSSIDLAPAAWQLANKVAGTDFAPKSLRGKPEAVLACILTGHEVGLSPMRSLALIHVVDGRPAMAAELMRALVLEAGHDIWIEEQTSTRVTIGGQRAGSSRETKVTWTMDDAKRANLSGKQNWRSYPRAMLLARATSELCRAVFPDVLSGISHTIEELSDGDEVPEVDLGPVEAAPAPAPAKATARANRAATTEQAPADVIDERPPPTRGEVPALPGEDDDVIDAEIVEHATGSDPDLAAATEVPGVKQRDEVEDEFGETEADADGPSDFPEIVEDDYVDDDPAPADPGPRLSGAQMLAIRFNEAGITDRAERLAIVAEIIGREVTSSNQLDADEVRAISDWLSEHPPATVSEPEEAGSPAEPSEVEEEQRPPAPSSSTASRRTAVSDPEEWTGEQWRQHVSTHRKKVVAAVKEAQRLAVEAGYAGKIVTLDDVAGTGLAGALADWMTQ